MSITIRLKWWYINSTKTVAHIGTIYLNIDILNRDQGSQNNTMEVSGYSHGALKQSNSTLMLRISVTDSHLCLYCNVKLKIVLLRSGGPSSPVYVAGLRRDVTHSTTNGKIQGWYAIIFFKTVLIPLEKWNIFT